MNSFDEVAPAILKHFCGEAPRQQDTNPRIVGKQTRFWGQNGRPTPARRASPLPNPPKRQRPPEPEPEPGAGLEVRASLHQRLGREALEHLRRQASEARKRQASAGPGENGAAQRPSRFPEA